MNARLSVCLSVCVALCVPLSVSLSVSVSVCSRNILDSQNASYLQSCRYDSQSSVDRLCPVFVLADIVREVQTDANDTFDSIALLVTNYSVFFTSWVFPSGGVRLISMRRRKLLFSHLWVLLVFEVFGGLTRVL